MFYVYKYVSEKSVWESVKMYNNLMDYLTAIFKTISGSKSEEKKEVEFH